MDVAEGDDDVGGAGRNPGFGRGADREGGRARAAIERGVGRGELAEAVEAAIGRRRIICAAAIDHIRCDDLAIPAAAGKDLDHGVGRLDLEEGQGLRGVPIAVARDIGRGAQRRGDGRGEAVLRGRGRDRGGGDGGKREDGGQRDSSGGQSERQATGHGSVLD